MDRQLPDTLALNLFRWTAREGTVTAAAERFGIGQPHASRLLAALQRRLGVVLLVKTGRVLKPTDAGLLFLEQVERALAEVEGLWEGARTISAGRRPPVRLLVQSHLAHGLMPGVLADLRERLPSVRIDLDIRQKNRLSQWASRAASDAVFATLPFEAGWGESLPLFETRYLAAVPRTHPLAAARRVAVADLAGQPFVNVRAGLTTRDLLQEMCARQGGVPETVVETGSVLSAVQLAAAGLGLALSDPFLAHGFRDDGRIVFRPIEGGPRSIYCLVVADAQAPWAQALRDAILREALPVLRALDAEVAATPAAPSTAPVP